jgi:hypothetical protein
MGNMAQLAVDSHYQDTRKGCDSRREIAKAMTTPTVAAVTGELPVR